MTEAAFFTIGRSRSIGYGKIRPLANYRSRSRLSIIFQKLYPLGAGSLEIRIAMKHEIRIKYAHVFFKLRKEEKDVFFGKFSMAD
jgi:hypothetical protein